eukprot:SAG31_NODE_7606_length_1643_cov_1.108161_2_plen_191_part_00
MKHMQVLLRGANMALMLFSSHTAASVDSSAPASSRLPWDDRSLSVDARVAMILNALNDTEKVAQLSYHTLGSDGDHSHAGPTSAGKACAAAGGCGGLRCDAKRYFNASACLDWANQLQASLKAHARVFVPVQFFCETTHAGGNCLRAWNGACVSVQSHVLGCRYSGLDYIPYACEIRSTSFDYLTCSLCS